MNIDSIMSKDEKGEIRFGGSIAINSIMNHFYKKDVIPLTNIFFINLFTLYTNVFKVGQYQKNIELFKDEISIVKLYIETYVSLIKVDMPYIIIFYIPDYQYIPKDKRLINTISLDTKTTKKNKEYLVLMKEWTSIMNTKFSGLDTSLSINDDLSVYFLKYGNRYGLPYKSIIRDINKIKLSNYITNNIALISNVPLDYFSITGKDSYLLERYTGNLLRNFDKKTKYFSVPFNKFTIQFDGDGMMLAPHPEILPHRRKLKKLSIENKWNLKTNDELLKEINTLIKIKKTEFISL